jgi:hydroxyacylglutathione hydrolase
MIIECIQSGRSDNWFYLLADDQRRGGVLIDPIDPEAALARAAALGVEVSWVLNTHWHPDHTGGNAAVLAATGAKLAIPARERGLIQGGDLFLEGGQRLPVGQEEAQILDSPGHTVGHIAVLAGRHFFCGDTIFVGGAGNVRFGGDAVTLAATFRDVLGALPDDTLIYPGHDYAVRNLEFCLHIDPDNEAAARRLEEVRASTGLAQSTLGQERASSVFCRVQEAGLQARLRALAPEVAHADPATRAFVALRALRDRW